MAELLPCPKCNGEGVERIGYGYPIIICGVECNRTLGTIIVCRKCGFHSNAYDEPIKAYNDWNTRTKERGVEK